MTTRSCIRAGLLMIGSLAFFDGNAAAIDVSVDEGRVTLRAENAPIEAVLEALVAESGLELINQATPGRVVSLELDGLTLADTLLRLLESDDSFQLYVPAEREPNNSAVPILWVFDSGTGDVYVIEYLETMLLRGSVSERKSAIRRLADLATPGAVNALALAVADDDERVRRAAMRALTDIGDESALAVLASAMADDDPAVRARIANSLGRAHGPEPLAYLDIALRDDDPRVRTAAAEALGDLGDPTARQRLREALKDDDPDVRERALDVLEDLDDEAMFHTVFPAQ